MADMWIYPAGMVVGGNVLSVRTVLGPLPFISNDVSYGVAFLSHFSAAELAAFGIKGFAEDVLPAFSVPGSPLDVETDTHVQRTYPDASIDIDAQFDAAMAAITKKYNEKRAALQADIPVILVVDGAGIDANLTTLRENWATLSDEEEMEILELFT